MLHGKPTDADLCTPGLDHTQSDSARATSGEAGIRVGSEEEEEEEKEKRR